MRVNKRQHAKLRGDRSNRCRDMAVFRFLKITAVRHLGFVVRVFGPPAKRIWWSLSLCKIGESSRRFWLVHFALVVDDEKCIVVTRVCVCLCVCLAGRGRMLTLLHGPGCNLGEW